MQSFACSCLFVMLVAPATAGAISISFQQSSLAVGEGETIALDLIVSDLGSETVGSYDMDVTFDSTHLAFDGLAFGEFLGGEASALQDVVFSAGLVDFAELSLLSPGDLDALQPDSFVLASLYFQVTAVGTSQVSISDALVGDPLGRRLNVDSLGSAEISAAIPEPGGHLLFGLATLVVGFRLRGRP